GNMEIFRLLIRFGANPNDEECLFQAFTRRAFENDTNGLSNILLRTCQKEFLARGGVKALYHAILRSELDVVRLLLEHGVDCNTMTRSSQDKKLKTCLGAAIEVNNPTVLQMVLDTGVGVNTIVERDIFKEYTALVKAIQCQNFRAIDMLIAT